MTLFRSHSREKLINAMIYFVKNTKRCHTLKLFKLLNFLDFEHYRQTGRSVTGLTYKAWPEGPAPNELWHELKSPRPDMLEALSVSEIKDDLTNKLLSREIRALHPFDSQYFSKREMSILERLVFFFKDLNAGDMSEISHEQRRPWRKVFRKGEGKGQQIDYGLALDSEPIVYDVPTIDADELEYRNRLLEETKAETD